MLATTKSPNRMDKRAARAADPNRFSFGKTLAWSAPGMSYTANAIILMYVTIYATDTLQLPAALVGTALLLAKLVDAVGTLLGAWIIDRSRETRWGKARPYDLCVVGLWVFTGVTFSTPGDWPMWSKLIWLIVSYIVVTSVFDPLFSGAGLLYMARALPSREVYAKAAGRGGVLSGITAIAISAAVPVVLNASGKSPEGWSMTVWLFAIPLAVLGLLRFFTIPEKYKTENADLPKVSLRDIWGALKSNRWLWVLMLIQLAGSIAGNIGAAAYYFRYVVGDLSLAAVLAPLGILILPLVLLLPRMIRRFTVSQLIIVASALGAVGFTFYFFANGNLGLLLVGGVLVSISAVPVSFLLPILLLDTSALNEWSGKRRLESMNGAIVSFAQNVGMGISAGMAGWILGAAGYNGSADQQSPSALFAIEALMGLVPGVIILSVVVLAWFSHRYERNMPAIRSDLEERHIRSGAKDADSVEPTTTELMTIAEATVSNPVAEGGAVGVLKASKLADADRADEKE